MLRKEITFRQKAGEFDNPVLDPSLEAEIIDLGEYPGMEDEDEYRELSDEEGTLMKDINDHPEPVHDGEKPIDDFAVLGFPRKNMVTYVAERSKALIRFFEIMHIGQIYLMDELKYDWLRFPFRSREKQAAMQNIIQAPSYREAFQLDIGELENILPLFNYSGRHSMPIIFLVSTDDRVPVAMFLCDDGNFHTDFHSSDREKIFYAASAVGLVMGGTDVCADMYRY